MFLPQSNQTMKLYAEIKTNTFNLCIGSVAAKSSYLPQWPAPREVCASWSSCTAHATRPHPSQSKPIQLYWGGEILLWILTEMERPVRRKTSDLSLYISARWSSERFIQRASSRPKSCHFKLICQILRPLVAFSSIITIVFSWHDLIQKIIQAICTISFTKLSCSIPTEYKPGADGFTALPRMFFFRCCKSHF